MKSVILSIILFIIVFTALELGAIKLLDNRITIYFGLSSVIISLILALHYVGLPSDSNSTTKSNKTLKKKEQQNEDK